jgi:hypothetical protein
MVDREKRDLKRMNYHLDHLDQNCERRVGVSFRDFDLDSSSCCFVSQLRPWQIDLGFFPLFWPAVPLSVRKNWIHAPLIEPWWILQVTDGIVQLQRWEEGYVVECMWWNRNTLRWGRKSFWGRDRCSWQENQHWLIDRIGFWDGYSRLWLKESSPGECYWIGFLIGRHEHVCCR